MRASTIPRATVRNWFDTPSEICEPETCHPQCLTQIIAYSQILRVSLGFKLSERLQLTKVDDLVVKHQKFVFKKVFIIRQRYM